MQTNSTTLSFYFRSSTPLYTYTLSELDSRLSRVLEDVRMIRHGNHIFVHLRNEDELERAMHCLGEKQAMPQATTSTAA